MQKYSVLMSVYCKDVPEQLKISIDSMLNQTVKPEQFVLVQDGPLGEELESVIQEYANANPDLFTVVPLKENIGLGRALDVGLKECRNDLVARMDADDISLPERCEKLLKLFEENSSLGLAGTNIDEFYNEPTNVQTSRIVPSEYEDIKKFIRRRSPFNHPTVMFKRSEVERCGGYGMMKRKQDFDLFSRMINMGCYALNINESLLLFRADEGNYKRRKSKEYVKSTIEVQKLNYKRGYCSRWDLTVVTVGQWVLRLTPMWLMKWLSDHLLRKKKK
jgi:glycosyltransferase involved in cell wall biosynthesis